jgi:carbonic anhydrase
VNLFQGILRFQKEDFETQRALFSKLGKEQKPHTLFIGCSDSRVVPTLITKTYPGELFMVRNVANIVPPLELSDHDHSTAAAIEFAVLVLNVETIVICGHSNCGGCAALYSDPSSLSDMPHLQEWLKLSAGVTGRVDKLLENGKQADREWLTEQVNILVQMSHLHTYPYIAERVAAGTLEVQGWHYLIESGEVLIYDDDSGHFETVSP